IVQAAKENGSDSFWGDRGQIVLKRRRSRREWAWPLCIRFRQWRHWRNLNDVQPALSLTSAGPAPRPRIFARTNSPRAMRATDARIILIVKRVIRYVVFVEIAPNLFRSPIRDRIHLD